MTAFGGGFEVASAYVDVGVRDNATAAVNSIARNAQGRMTSTANSLRSSVGSIASSFQGMAGMALEPIMQVTQGFGGLSDSVERSSNKIGMATLKIGTGILAAGTAMTLLGARETQSTQQLAAAIQTTGGNYEDFAKQIEEAVKSGEHFGFSAVQTKDALSTLTLATHNPTEAMHLMGEATDLAAARHMSLNSAATAVARTVNGSGRLFKLYGIEIKKNADGTKDYAGANEQLARILQGQAAAAADTWLGHLKAIGATVEDHIALYGQKFGPAIMGIGASMSIVGTISNAVQTRMAAKAAEVAAAEANVGKAMQLSLFSSKAAESTGLISKLGVALGSLNPITVAAGTAFAVAGIGLLAFAHGVNEEKRRIDELATAIENGTVKTQLWTMAQAEGLDSVTKFGVSQQKIVGTLMSTGAAYEDGKRFIDGLIQSQGEASYKAGDFSAAQGTVETQTDATNRRLDEANQRLDTLHDEYEKAKQKAADWAKSQGDAGLATDITNEKMAGLAKASHMSIEDYTNARLAMDKKNQSQALSAQTTQLENDAIIAQHPEFVQQAKELGMTTDAFIAARDAQQKHTDAAEAATQAMQLENDAAGLLKQGIDALNGRTLDVTDAQFAFQDSLKRIGDELKNNGHSLDENTDKGRANLENISSGIRAAQAFAEAQVHNGVSTKQATKDYQAHIQTLKQYLYNMGLNHKAVDDFINANAKIPKLKETKYDVKTDEANAKIVNYQNAIDAIKQHKIPGLTANTNAGRIMIDLLNDSINSIKQGKPPLITLDKAKGIAEAGKLQASIDAIKQGKVPGLTANNKAGKAVIKELQETIDALKQGKKPPVDADIVPGKTTVATLQTIINDIKQGKLPGINVNTAAGKQLLSDLSTQIANMKGKDVPINLVTTNGQIAAFLSGFQSGNTTYDAAARNAITKASGGMLDGPGTGTSDSIPIWASKGEYVVNAKATQRYYKLLEMINGQGYAQGGAINLNVAESKLLDRLAYGLKLPIFDSVANHALLIKQALAIAGVADTSSNESAVNTIITSESNWNPNAINLVDSNAAAGHPSQGLMQTIPSTFNAYRVGWLSTSITDPLSNVVAGIRYAVSRYGSLSAVPGVAAVNTGGHYVGYAKGGMVGMANGGIVKTPQGWLYNGYLYGTQRAAINARTGYQKALVKNRAATLQRQRAAEQAIIVRIESTDFQTIGEHIFDSVHTLIGAENRLLNDVRKAISAGAAPTSLMGVLNRESALLTHEANLRDIVLGRLKAENTKLANLQTDWHNTHDKVMQSITGTFDIGTAGAGTTGASMGNLLASLKIDLQNAQQFSGTLARLKKLGLNKTLYEQLAEEGPGSANAKILQNATATQIKQINALYGGLNSVANRTGHIAADSMYAQGINIAKGLVRGLQSQEKSLESQMKRLADTMVKQIKKDLKVHSPSEVGHEIGSAFGEGIGLGVEDHYDKLARRVNKLAVSMAGGVGTPRGRYGHVHIEHFHLDVHEIQDIQHLMEIIHGIPQAVRAG